MTLLSWPTFSAVKLFERQKATTMGWYCQHIITTNGFTNSLIVLVLVLLVIKRKSNHNVVRTDVVNQLSLLIILLVIKRKPNHNVVGTDVTYITTNSFTSDNTYFINFTHFTNFKYYY